MKAIILLLICVCIISTVFSNKVHVERSWTESRALDIIKEELKYSADDNINCSVEKCCDISSNECSLRKWQQIKAHLFFQEVPLNVFLARRMHFKLYQASLISF